MDDLSAAEMRAFAKTRYTFYPYPATSQAFLHVDNDEMPAAIRLSDAYGRDVQLVGQRRR